MCNPGPAPSMRLKHLLLLAVVLAAQLALAQEEPPPPPVSLDVNKLRALAVFIVKGGVLAAFIIVLTVSLIRGVVGALEKSGGTATGMTGYRDLMEAFKGPIIFLLALALLVWLPDLLNWLGLLPDALRPYAIDWQSLFGG